MLKILFKKKTANSVARLSCET